MSSASAAAAAAQGMRNIAMLGRKHKLLVSADKAKANTTLFELFPACVQKTAAHAAVADGCGGDDDPLNS